MPRAPTGTTAATASRTAILGAVAARAALKNDGERQAFFSANRLRVSQRDISRALQVRRRPAGPKAPDDVDEREWIWPSFELDVTKLRVELVIAWFPRPEAGGPRPDQGSLVLSVASTPGVLRVYDCFDDTIVVLALATDSRAKRRLQDALRELHPGVLWTEVRNEDRDQPARGWLHIAREVARAEGRLR